MLRVKAPTRIPVSNAVRMVTTPQNNTLYLFSFRFTSRDWRHKLP